MPVNELREEWEREAERTENERRLAIMLQCSEAKTKAEARFADKYPPPCDWMTGEGVEL